MKKTIDKSQKLWYYIIKEREKNRNQKEVPQMGNRLVDVSNELSERILRFKAIGLLICRYFSSEEGEIPWQVKNHSAYAVRIAS